MNKEMLNTVMDEERKRSSMKVSHDLILKLAKGAMRGIHHSLIKDLVRMNIGDDSTWQPIPKIKPLASDEALALFKGNTPVALVINHGYGGMEIYDAKTGKRIPIEAKSVKMVVAILKDNHIDYDAVMQPTKIDIKQHGFLTPNTKTDPTTKERQIEYTDPKTYKRRWVSMSEYDKLKRKDEASKPLMDMADAKGKVWKERFQKSLPLLEKMIQSKVGIDVRLTAPNANNSKFFQIEVKPTFSGKDLGVLRYSIESAEFYLYANPSSDKEEIWFPLKMNWAHPAGGGTNGHEVNIGGKSVDFWFDSKTGEWSTK
jgi:hypothetical protein